MKQAITLSLLLLFCISAISKSGKRLFLRSGEITPEENFESRYLATSSKKEAYFIMQFSKLPDEKQKQAITATGIAILDYLPQDAFLVRIPANYAFSSLNGMAVSSVLPYLPEYKASDYYLLDVPDFCAEGEDNIRLNVNIFDGFSEQSFYQTMTGLKGRVNWKAASGNYYEVILPTKNREDLLKISGVKWVEFGEAEPVHDDMHARTLHRVHNLQNGIAGRNYDGTGVNVSLVDDASIANHIDLQGRITQVGSFGGNGSHGDGTVGIVMGAGNLDPVRGAGMATNVTMRYYDYISQANYPHIAAAVTNYNNFGTIATSSSYSEFNGFGGQYIQTSHDVDEQVRLNPSIQHVFSAGNSSGSNSPTYNSGVGGINWGTITGGRKAAKSVIAVAALDYEDVLAGYSSRGPAEDGRIKPDISSYGNGQISLDNAANTYQTFGGTSAACPGITGTVAVMYQAYREHNAGVDPDAALIKAMLLNSADDLGNPGPDFYFGWGRVNALRAVRILENNQYMSSTISLGNTNTHTIPVPAGVQELKVMVYWNDYEGSVIASKALVNDLDMELETPGSTVFLPWTLDHRDLVSALSANAVRGIDTVNNVEQVTLSAPASGNYTLRVNGTTVPQGPQRYFVVYEYRYAKPEITYPTGGESFVPGEVESIRWNATPTGGTFDLSYSVDNGSTWYGIITGLQNSLRSFDWLVPDSVSGDALIRITNQGLSDTSDASFSIIQVPSNLNVAWACTDSVRLSWDSVEGATSYQVYRLGATHMDSVGTAYGTTSLVLNGIPSTGTEWFSVHAQDIGNMVGRRAVAIEKAPGTFGCPVAIDGAITNIISPAGGSVPDCHSFDSIHVKVEVSNTGVNPISNFQLSYQLNSLPIVTETYVGSISSFQSVEYEFSSIISLSGSSADTLRAWITVSGDLQPFNDELVNVTSQYPSTVITLGAPWVETFDQMSTCPTTNNCGLTNCVLSGGWRNTPNGFGDDIDFRVDAGTTPSNGTGPFGDHTTGNGNFIYTEASFCFDQDVLLASPCLDLGGTVAPELRFWYNMRGPDMGDLHVDLIVDGDLVSDITPVISGDQGTAWLERIVDLTPYAGSMVTILFRGTTGPDFTSDIALDDISVRETFVFSQDVTIPQLTSPFLNILETCIIQDSIAVELVVENSGTLPVANFTVYYQLDNQAPASEPYLSVLPASSSDTIRFNKRFAVPALGSYNLKVWHDYSLDQNLVNDTLNHPLTVNASTPVSTPTLFTVDALANCPTTFNCGATVCGLGNSGFVNVTNGVGDDHDWRVNQGTTPSTGTGPAGDHTSPSGNGNYLYLEASNGCNFATAILESPCYDLTTLVDPKLLIWYHMLGADMGELHLDVGFGGVWVEDFAPPLVGAQGNSWQPWLIDLTFFSGAIVKFRIRGITGPDFASDMAIDDIEVYSGQGAPLAGFDLPSTTCQNLPVVIADSASGQNISYLWDFGPGASPATANTPGPHFVTFSQSGNITVTQIVTNPAGSDTLFQSIYVDSLPTADFTFSVSGDTAYFTNASLNFNNLFWDFGDGNTSMMPNPVHVYNSMGNYLVELTAENQCGNDMESTSVLVLNTLPSHGGLAGKVNLYPNPVRQNIVMEWSGNKSGNGSVNILDITGKNVGFHRFIFSNGQNEQEFDLSQLPAGTYFLRVNLGEEQGTFKIEKQ